MERRWREVRDSIQRLRALRKASLTERDRKMLCLIEARAHCFKNFLKNVMEDEGFKELERKYLVS